MARLFTAGFEDNNNTALSTTWTTVGGTTSISTTAGKGHSGTYWGRASGTGGFFQRQLGTPISTGTVYTRWYNYFEAIPALVTDLFRLRNGSAQTILFVQLLPTTGKIRLNNFITSTNFDSATNFSATTLYRIELEHVLSDTIGTMTIKVFSGDSTTPIETWGDTTANHDTLNANVSLYHFGQVSTTTTADIYYDDIAINDNSGSFQNSWCGPEKYYLIIPNSDVTTDWADQTGSPTETDSTYQNVDDVPAGAPDDATTYNCTTNGLNTQDRFGLTDLGSEVPSDATITLLDVYGRIGSNQTAAANMQFQIWDEAGTKTSGPTMNCNVNGWKFTNTNEHYVYNATGKTKADINSFNVGYENVSPGANTLERRISALWVNVGWLEAPAGGGSAAIAGSLGTSGLGTSVPGIEVPL